MVKLEDYVNGGHEPSWGQLIELYNRIGRGDVEAGSIKDFRAEYDTAVDSEISHRVRDLEESGFSRREAEVVVLKASGFTNAAVATYLDLGSTSTADEYLRRARQKYRDAVNLVKKLEDTGLFG